MSKRYLDSLVRKYLVTKNDANGYYQNLKSAKVALNSFDNINKELSDDQKIKLLEQTFSYVNGVVNTHFKTSMGFNPLEGDPLIMIDSDLFVEDKEEDMDYYDSGDEDLDDAEEDLEITALDFNFDYNLFFDGINSALRSKQDLPYLIISELELHDNNYFTHLISGEDFRLEDFSNRSKLKEYGLDLAAEDFEDDQVRTDKDHLGLNKDVMSSYALLGGDLDIILDDSASFVKDSYLLQDDRMRELMHKYQGSDQDMFDKAKQRLASNYLERTGKNVYSALKSLNGEDRELTDLLLDRIKI